MTFLYAFALKIGSFVSVNLGAKSYCSRMKKIKEREDEPTQQIYRRIKGHKLVIYWVSARFSQTALANG